MILPSVLWIDTFEKILLLILVSILVYSLVIQFILFQMFEI